MLFAFMRLWAEPSTPVVGLAPNRRMLLHNGIALNSHVPRTEVHISTVEMPPNNSSEWMSSVTQNRRQMPVKDTWGEAELMVKDQQQEKRLFVQAVEMEHFANYVPHRFLINKRTISSCTSHETHWDESKRGIKTFNKHHPTATLYYSK